jgi:hypothetical protein
MHQGLDPGFAPTLGHRINVVVEIAKNEVAMAINKTKIPRRSVGKRLGLLGIDLCGLEIAHGLRAMGEER